MFHFAGRGGQNSREPLFESGAYQAYTNTPAISTTFSLSSKLLFTCTNSNSATMRIFQKHSQADNYSCYHRYQYHESSSWRLLMPLGMFCFAQKYQSDCVIEKVISLIRIMLCYEINEQFHTLINSVTKELNGWWLMNDLQGQKQSMSMNNG